MHKVTKVILSFTFLISTLCTAIDSSKFIQNPKIIIINVETLISMQTKTVKHFGYWNSVKALFTQGDLRQLFLKKLSEVPAPVKGDFNNGGIILKHISGLTETIQMPNIQYNYLTGAISSKDCIKTINDWIDNNKNKFNNLYQSDLMKKLAKFYFDPTTYYQYHGYSSTINLMKKLFDEKTNEGKRKNIILLVGDQANEETDVQKKLLPNIFTYSDFQTFSGNEKQLQQNASLDYRLKDDVIKSLISMCPSTSYNTSFIIDNSLYSRKGKFILGHAIEILNPNDAESKLTAYGAI